jgi:hypothetical protein
LYIYAELYPGGLSRLKPPEIRKIFPKGPPLFFCSKN